MKTTLFGEKLIRSAEEVLAIGYRAGKHNQYGEKLERLVQEFDAAGTLPKQYKGAGKQQPDYCGITVSVIIDRAVRAFKNQQNTFRSAVAKWFLDEGKKRNLRVDNSPQPGCLFVTKRSGGSGYHVGFVWQIKGQNVQTIEGNTYCSQCFYVQNGCKVKLNNDEYGIVTRLRPIKKGEKYAPEAFIHIEELYGTTPLVDIPETEAMLSDTPVAGTFCYTGELEMSYDGGEGTNVAKDNVSSSKILGLDTKQLLIIGSALATIGVGIFLATNKH